MAELAARLAEIRPRISGISRAAMRAALGGGQRLATAAPPKTGLPAVLRSNQAIAWLMMAMRRLVAVLGACRPR